MAFSAPEVAAEIQKVRGVRPSGGAGKQLADTGSNRATAAVTRSQQGQGPAGPSVARSICWLRAAPQRVAALSVEHLQQRDGRWVIVDLIGKGLRIRSVPMPSWAKMAADRWTESAGITEGRILRAINKADRLVSDRMSAQSIFEIVERYSRVLGVPVAPHDLRRTFAKLAHRGQYSRRADPILPRTCLAADNGAVPRVGARSCRRTL